MIPTFFVFIGTALGSRRKDVAHDTDAVYIAMKRLLAFVFATMLAGQVWAYNFQCGDLYYSITSDSTVAVACQTEWDNRHNNYLGLTTITIPESVTYDGCLYAVTSIGGWAFQYCSSLTSVTIPESVISIGLYAFDGCIGLKNITIPDGVTAIGNSAFYNVGNIIYTGNAEGSPWGALAVNGIIDGDFVYSDAEKKKIALYIGDSTNVTIPVGVTQIGARAFYNCSNIETIFVPSSVTYIGEDAFYSIGNVIYTGNAEGSPWGAFAVNGIIDGDFVYSDAEKKKIALYIGDSTDVTIPAGVTQIGARAFYNSKLTKVIISDSVKSIGTEAFYSCPLTFVTIPISVDTIGRNAFSSYNATFYCEANSLPSNWGGYYYDYNYGGTYYGSWNNNNGKVIWGIFVDNDIAYKKSRIYDYNTGNYNYSDSLVNLITYLGGSSSMEIPAKVTHLGNEYKVTSIGSEAFRNCKGLKSISIPKSVISIGSCAFSDCDSLQKAEFASIESLCGIDFYDCLSNPLFYAKKLYVSGEEVTDVVIPDSVESIGQYAFYNCDNLTSVSIPYSVTSIGQYVFNQCYGLTSVSIPNSVTAIGYGAFKDCINLTIYCQAKIKHSGWDEKWNISKCPVSWGATLNTVTVKSENNTGGKVTGAGVYINNLTVTITAIPAVGYHFVSWSDGNTDNPRIINANGDLDLSAVFDDTYRITATAQNGTIAYDTVYHEGDTATITATPSIGYHFVGWSDGSTDNPRVLVVAKDSAINALFELNTYSITATAENGTVSGTATYNYGTVATLTATPNQGYHFVKWDDGNTDNPRMITVSEELTLSAIFEADENQGGENQGGNENNTATAVTESSANSVNIFATDKTIVVENATEEIRVYNAMGALVGRDVARNVSTITINNSGVYIVKTGNTVKRVVVN